MKKHLANASNTSTHSQTQAPPINQSSFFGGPQGSEPSEATKPFFTPSQEREEHENVSGEKEKRKLKDIKPARRSERNKKAKETKEYINVAGLKLIALVIDPGTQLHHSSEEEILILADRAMYLSGIPHGENKHAMVFTPSTALSIVDLSQLENVQELHKKMIEENQDALAELLRQKVGGKPKSGRIKTISGFKTIGKADDAKVHTWFEQKGLPGWYGPLSGMHGEYMLTTPKTSGLMRYSDYLKQEEPSEN